MTILALTILYLSCLFVTLCCIIAVAAVTIFSWRILPQRYRLTGFVLLVTFAAWVGMLVFRLVAL